MKTKTEDDEELTEASFSEYSVIAHDHFSSRIHMYIHNKEKWDISNMSAMSGVFPGRYKAIRAVKILFASVRSPTKDRHKK